ncbi:MAG: hypothetical protein ACYDD4_02500 [Acidimicrobiales bacterium]
MRRTAQVIGAAALTFGSIVSAGVMGSSPAWATAKAHSVRLSHSSTVLRSSSVHPADMPWACVGVDEINMGVCIWDPLPNQLPI